MNQNWDIATPYAAAYVLFYQDNKLACTLRLQTGWNDGNYGIPSGRVEKREPILTAAIREANEEVGAVIKPGDLEHRLTMYRYSEDDQTYWVDVYFEAKAWSGELKNGEPGKHGEVTWLDPNNLPDNFVESVKAALEAIAAGKAYAEFGWDSNS